MRSTLSLPALTVRRNVFALVLAVLLVAAPGGAWPAGASSDAQQPAAQQAPPAQQPPAAQPAPTDRKFTSATGMFFNVIKADKVADFEKFIGLLHEALSKTDKEDRKKQAAGWRVFKSTTPDAQGNVVYIFFMDPTADVDYTLTRIMVDVFPREEVQKIYESIKDAWVTQSMVNLDLIANFGVAK